MIQKVGLTVIEKNYSKIKNVNPLLKNAPKTCVEKLIPSQKKSVQQLKRFLVELKDSIKNSLKNIFNKNELEKINKVQIAKDIRDEIEVKEAENLLKNPKVSDSIKRIIKDELEYAIKTSNNNDDFSCYGLSCLKQANLKAKQELERQKNGATNEISFRGYIDDKTIKELERKEFNGKYDDLDFEEAISKELSHKQDTKLHDLDITDPYNETMMRRHFEETIEQEEPSLIEALKHNQESHHNADIIETVNEHSEDLTEQLFD